MRRALTAYLPSSGWRLAGQREVPLGEQIGSGAVPDICLSGPRGTLFPRRCNRPAILQMPQRWCRVFRNDWIQASCLRRSDNQTLSPWWHRRHMSMAVTGLNSPERLRSTGGDCRWSGLRWGDDIANNNSLRVRLRPRRYRWHRRRPHPELLAIGNALGEETSQTVLEIMVERLFSSRKPQNCNAFFRLSVLDCRFYGYT